MKLILDDHQSTLYFKELFAVSEFHVPTDSQFSPLDDEATLAQKLKVNIELKNNHLGVLRKISALSKSRAFRDVEQSIYQYVRNLESVSIWDAILKNNEAEIFRITAERMGIIRFFEVFNGIETTIKKLEAEIALHQEGKPVYPSTELREQLES